MPLVLLDVWLHSSLSIFTHSAKFRLDFCWCNACKSEISIFQTHAGEWFLISLSWFSCLPTLIPARLYKVIDKAGEKNYSYQPAAGKILEKYFQRWTTTKLQVKGKHQVALESNLYLVSKLFCDPLLKLRLIFFILLPRSCKSN